MANVIDQFMWQWQPHFRVSVGVLVEMALKRIGAQLDPQILLVGLIDAEGAPFPICIEPETAALEPSHLAGVRDRARELYDSDPERLGFNTDPAVDASRHAYLRNTAMGAAIAELAESSGALGHKRVFGSAGGRVGDFDVHVLIAVDQRAFDAVPALEMWERDAWPPATQSLAHAVIEIALREADAALRVPEPTMGDVRRSHQDVVRAAAEQLCTGCLHRTRNFYLSSSFDAFNDITARAYEGAGAAGRLVFVRPGHEDLLVSAALAEPVPLTATRGVRKLLQTTNEDVALLIHDGGVFGIGDLVPEAKPPDVFEVAVTAHATWELRRDDTTLMRVAYGRPTLPRPNFDETTVRDVLDRIFESKADLDRLIGLIEAAADANHGTTLSISAEAAHEAERLAGPSTRLKPQVLSHELLLRYAEMDGALLIDPSGICHAIGVILDGAAQGVGDPARGARYNSAIRYQAAATCPTVVVVVSEDGGVDLVPMARRRIRRQTVADAIARLEQSPAAKSPTEFSDAFEALEDLNFYLSAEECERVNAMAQAEFDRRMMANEFARMWPKLFPHPEMEGSYFFD